MAIHKKNVARIEIVRNAINQNADAFYREFLGEPNESLSRRGQELKYGSRGSLKVTIRGEKAGLWFNHETHQGGDGINMLMDKLGLEFHAAMKVAERWAVSSSPTLAFEPQNRIPHPTISDRASFVDCGVSLGTRIDAALRIWEQSVPISNTPAQTYLEQRSIVAGDYQHALRFHKACPRGGQSAPALVCLFRNIQTDEPQAIHRTYLTTNGEKKFDRHGQSKMMLGPVKDAAIKLSPDEEVSHGLGICEGVEDGLSILQAGWQPIWVAGSAGAVAQFPVLSGIDCLTIFADCDEAGEKASLKCASRWVNAGYETTLKTPRPPLNDWNSALQAETIS